MGANATRRSFDNVPPSSYPESFALDDHPIAILSLGYEYLDANPAFERDFEISMTVARGRGVAWMWSFETERHGAEVDRQLQASELAAIDLEPSGLCPAVYPATLLFTAIVDPSGERIGFSLAPVAAHRRRHNRRTTLEPAGLQLAFDQIVVPMMLIGLDGYPIKCNRAAARLFECSVEEVIATPVLSRWHPDDRVRGIEQAIQLIAGQVDGYTHETRLLTDTGTQVWVEETATCVRDESGEVIHIMVQYVDIGARKIAEANVLEGQATIRFLFEGTPVPLVSLNPMLEIVSANEAMSHLLGRDPIGVPIAEVVHPDDFATIAAQGAAIRPDTDWIVEIRICRADGSERLVRSHGRIHLDDEGLFRSASAAWYDITEARLEEDALRTRAATEPLTGLANRTTLLEKLQQALEGATEPDDVAVLFIDIDRFKPINDQFGHAAGDAVLCEIANRLRECVRSDDLVARIGGDEFVVMIDSSASVALPVGVGTRIIERLRRPISLSAGNVVVAASVGMALGGRGSDPHDVVERADAAAYRAKAAGGSQLAVAATTGGERSTPDTAGPHAEHVPSLDATTISSATET